MTAPETARCLVPRPARGERKVIYCHASCSDWMMRQVQKRLCTFSSKRMPLPGRGHEPAAVPAVVAAPQPGAAGEAPEELKLGQVRPGRGFLRGLRLGLRQSICAHGALAPEGEQSSLSASLRASSPHRRAAAGSWGQGRGAACPKLPRRPRQGFLLGVGWGTLPFIPHFSCCT